jgi:hypothetical protein
MKLRCGQRVYTAERKPLIKVIFALFLFIYPALQLPSANTHIAPDTDNFERGEISRWSV